MITNNFNTNENLTLKFTYVRHNIHIMDCWLVELLWEIELNAFIKSMHSFPSGAIVAPIAVFNCGGVLEKS